MASVPDVETCETLNFITITHHYNSFDNLKNINIFEKIKLHDLKKKEFYEHYLILRILKQIMRIYFIKNCRSKFEYKNIKLCR